MDIELIFQNADKILSPENLLFILKGAGISLVIATIALLFGTIFGILGAAGKILRTRF